MAIGVFLAIGTAVSGHLGLSGKRRPVAFWSCAVMIFSVVVLLLTMTLPLVNRWIIQPPQELASIAGMNLGADDRLVVYGLFRPSLLFYARHPVLMIPAESMDRLAELQPSSAMTMVLLPSHLISTTAPPLSGYHRLLSHSGYSLLGSRMLLPVELPGEPASR